MDPQSTPAEMLTAKAPLGKARPPYLAITGAVLATVLVVGGALWFFRGDPPNPVQQPAPPTPEIAADFERSDTTMQLKPEGSIEQTEPETLEPVADPNVLLNSTLMVSETCAERLTQDPNAGPFQFSGGVSTGIGQWNSTIDIVQVETARLDGSTHYLAWIDCHNDVADPRTDLVVYDLDLNLVDSPNYVEGVQGKPNHYTGIVGFTSSDNELLLDSGTGMGPDDTWCLSCEGSLTARSRFNWEGTRFVLQEVAYLDQSGTVVYPDFR